MLRIGLVIDDGLDRPDGVQQYVLTLGRRLTALGHEVHYLASQTERTDLDHLHVLGRHLGVRFNGNTLGTPLPASRIGVRTLLDELQLDVLHVQMPYSPFLAGRVVALAPARTAVVGTFHIYPQSGLVRVGARALGLVLRRQLRRFDSVVAVSQAAQEFAHEAFGLRTGVLANPVELARFAPLDDDGRPGAAGSGEAGGGRPEPGRPVRIVFLGRLVDRKGPRELLAAAAEVARRGSTTADWTLTIAGRGPLLDELRAAAERDGLRDRVDLPGFVAEEDKAALLADADIVALPSTGGESFGISVVEAMAAARGIVLAGDNPGYRTTMLGLEDQLVDARDTAGFADVLARWVDDSAGRDRAAVRQRVAARQFDAGTITARVLDWYGAAVAGRGRAPGGGRPAGGAGDAGAGTPGVGTPGTEAGTD
ncbi:phosphatidyl-myo-inositol mannosyltransferase [Actinomycetota bacterium]|nr:phosphatidyl-myo-inositol mannosyltransferase [Actinomycetota bacterium]